MFNNCSNSNLKGNVGLGLCMSYFMKKGLIVCLPINDSQPYDIVFDDGSNLKKVQVKTTSQKSGDYFKVKVESCSHNYNKHFNPDECDYLFVLCEDSTMYLIPTEHIKVKTILTLDHKFDKFIVD